jgi:hypothetical protein
MSSVPRPNLFIVGAMKSGTSSLHSHLGTHPSIFMCEPKEPCYFVDPEQLEWPAIRKLELWREEERYLRLFAAARQHRVVGESSTLYSKAPKIGGVPERIFRFCSDARILYIMRDPIQRTISHYWHAVRGGRERLGLLEALRRDPHYMEVSDYALQIEPYLDLFGEDRVRLLTLEELRARPSETMRALFAWLDVDPSFVPPNLETRRNVTPEVFERPAGRGLLHRLRYSRAWERVGPYIPASVRGAGRRLSMEQVRRDQHDVDAAVAYLRPAQQKQTARLEQLAGRSFPEWRTLFG